MCNDYADMYRDLPPGGADTTPVLGLNPINSTRIDGLYTFVDREWPGIDWAWEEKPWSGLDDKIEQLDRHDVAVIRSSPDWDEFIDERFVSDSERAKAMLASASGG